MGHMVSGITGLASGARTLSQQYYAEIQDARSAGVTTFNDSLMVLALALDELMDAKAKAAAILNDPRYSVPTKTADARAVVVEPLTAA